MRNPLVRRLVLKDLYLNRWLIVLALAGCLVSIAMAAFGRIGFFVGMISYITTIIVFGLFVGMESATRESRERISIFIQTLPVSTSQYAAAKVVAALIAYCAVWVPMTATLAGLTLGIDAAANGSLPMTMAVQGLLFMNFCVLLVIGILTHSPRWTTAAIILTNMSVTLFMVTLFNIPAVQQVADGPTVVWNAVVLWALAAEVLAVAIAFVILVYVHSRKKDFT